MHYKTGYYVRALNKMMELQICVAILITMTPDIVSEACKDGIYGKTCIDKCPDECIACTSPDDCQLCKNGFYGQRCEYHCPERCMSCDNSTMCGLCRNGYFGPVCNEACKLCKPNSPCRQLDGICLDGCADGQTGHFCNETCYTNCKECNRYKPDGCTACVNGKYGSHTDYKNGMCTRRCPGNCANRSCDFEFGFCQHGCEPMFYGFACEYHCPLKCVNKVCDQANGICTYGCEDGVYGDTCSCPINCICNENEKCVACKNGFSGLTQGCRCSKTFCSGVHCETCIDTTYFASDGVCCPCSNSCKNGECLSEYVCTYECEPGFFGTNCSVKCSDIDPNCKMCATYSNVPTRCTQCNDGYFFTKAGECNDCPRNCQNAVCATVTGDCTNGCKDGFWGQRCHEKCKPECALCERDSGACVPGHYLPEYGKNCSSNCINDNSSVLPICHASTGRCLHGCSVGYFGYHCLRKCDQRCLNWTCDQLTGECKEEYNQGMHISGTASSNHARIQLLYTATRILLPTFITTTAILIVIVGILLFLRKRKGNHTLNTKEDVLGGESQYEIVPLQDLGIAGNEEESIQPVAHAPEAEVSGYEELDMETMNTDSYSVLESVL